MNRTRLIGLTVAGSLLLGGCASLDGTTANRAATGAAVGAAGGAAVGVLTGGILTNAVRGAVAGAAGGVVYDQIKKNQ